MGKTESKPDMNIAIGYLIYCILGIYYPVIRVKTYVLYIYRDYNKPL